MKQQTSKSMIVLKSIVHMATLTSLAFAASALGGSDH